METREKFEELPHIKDKLDSIYYCEDIECYTEKKGYKFCSISSWVNGAWYAFQEQENKIKALEKELEMRKQGAMVMSHHQDGVLSICREYWCDDDRDYNIYIQRIEELLK